MLWCMVHRQRRKEMRICWDFFLFWEETMAALEGLVRFSLDMFWQGDGCFRQTIVKDVAVWQYERWGSKRKQTHSINTTQRNSRKVWCVLFYNSFTCLSLCECYCPHSHSFILYLWVISQKHCPICSVFHCPKSLIVQLVQVIVTIWTIISYNNHLVLSLTMWQAGWMHVMSTKHSRAP